MIGGGDPFYLKFWVKLAALERNQSIFACSASAVTPSEKSSVNTNRKSTTRFPMSLRWSLYVAPKPRKGMAQKHKTAVFRVKSHFAWRKSATIKFLCVKTVSDKVVIKAFIGPTIRAKMIGATTLLHEILGQTDRVGAKSPIFDLFSLVARRCKT